jgi:hypothetical protein
MTVAARGETERHRLLKANTLVWAREQGYTACAFETRLPNCGYRADVVAYKPDARKLPVIDSRTQRTRMVRQPVLGTTAVFECKQVRSDFARDSHSAEPTRARLKALDERRLKLEELLKVHHPSLRTGDSLFEGFESYDFSKLEHKTYQKIVREIGVLQNRLFDRTKFEKLVRYRCANLFYLVAEEGVLADHESPLGWGLLLHRGNSLELVRKPVWHDCPEPNRLWVLQRIAMAGTRSLSEPRIEHR